MAVPTDAYQTYSLRDTVSGTQRQVFKFAKLTSPYPTVADAKTLFKLDGVINEGTSSFIGYVEKNSANYIFHSPLRMDSYLFGDSHILLTDGGLNRMADKPIFRTISTISTSLDVSDNSVSVVGDFTSPYYNDVNMYLDLADSENLNLVSRTSLGALSQNGTQTINNQKFTMSDDIIINSESTYVLNLVSGNTEGESSSTPLSITPAPKYKDFNFGTTLDLAIAATAGTGVYINRRLSDAVVADVIIFYGTENKSSYAGTGYYLNIDVDQYGYRKFFRVTTGEGRVTEIGNIVAARHQDIYYYYSAISEGDALQEAPGERVIYYKVEITPPGNDFENRTYYISAFSTSLYAAKGYYVKEDRVTSLYVGDNGAAEVLVG